MTNDEKRRRLKTYYAESAQVHAERERVMAAHHKREARRFNRTSMFTWKPLPPPDLPPPPDYPDECRGVTCGAKTRAGTPCKRVDLYGSGRCPLHGGLSTGPTTPEGKARSASNGNAPKRKQTP